MISTIHMPPYPWSYVKPTMTVEEIGQRKQEYIKLMWNRLQYLANPVPNHEPRNASCCCTITPWCDNSPCNLGFYIINKVGRIFIDACCCCFESNPERKTWVSEQMYHKFTLSRQSFHRNLIGLCCIAPATIIGTPFITQAIALKVMTIVSGLITLETAGTMTYVFSGDIGILRDRIHNQLRLEGGYRASTAATENAVHVKLAEFLENSWNAAPDPADPGEWEHADEVKVWNAEEIPVNKAQIWRLCNGIIRCWNDLENGFRTVGITEDMIGQILDPMSNCLSTIKVARSHYPYYQPEPVLQPAPLLLREMKD